MFFSVESLVDVLFSAILGNFHDAYEEFVNTLKSIKIMMIRVFFSAGGSARIACIRISSPPPIFTTAFYTGQHRLQQTELASLS